MESNKVDTEKMARFFKSDNPKEDENYINKVFCNEENEKELKEFLYDQFENVPVKDEKNTRRFENILYRIHHEINKQSSKQKNETINNIMKWSMRIASLIMLPIVIGIGIRSYKDKYVKQNSWVEINAPAWTRVQFSLPDGTTGWLNSNSSLRYNDNFISDRNITLVGEAFFDVYKDKKRPFKVMASDITLSVLGTRFNISAYKNEKDVEVVLEEGKLVFSNKELTSTYTMKPNDLVIYDKTQKVLTSEVVQPQKYLSWKEGKLIFRNDPLDVIARRLERWYNVEVEISPVLTDDLRLRATFIDEDIEQVLNLLKRSLPIDYKIVNRDLKTDETYSKKKIIISPRIKPNSL